ncbi:MAG: hypothetical protein CVU04_02825 [Bacteroidetes bacterium HGW-Bacteroidetes-20]|nr:MAG: hypothetical protein CVU04_02825 [Bacteroidetes bacterium HGW-Bacteroidetes-20]
MIRPLKFSDYFSDQACTVDQIVHKLSDLYFRFPASSVVNLFYLKLLQDHDPKLFEQVKSKILLTLPNRALVLNCSVVLPKLQHEMLKNSVQTNTQIPEVSDPIQADEISQLIDKFTINPPKMIFDPARHDPNANYAVNSNKEDFELISETLAMVYADQGYVGKAEKMFKKLGLLFPEKSSYFADQIKMLKSKDINP